LAVHSPTASPSACRTVRGGGVRGGAAEETKKPKN